MYDANLSYEENYTKGPFPLLTLEKKFPKIQYTQKPKYEFLDVPLHIPFGVPAGPLLNSKFVQVALDAGFCLPIYKTVRSAFWKCNEWPNVLSIQSAEKSLFAQNHNRVISSAFKEQDYFLENLSISNSFGVPSQNSQIWAEDFQSLSPYSKKEGYSAALSFQPSKSNTQSLFLEDAQKIAQLAANCVNKNGFHFLEINLSCPNEKHNPIYKDLQSVLPLLRAVHQVIKNFKNVKLIAKIGVLTQEEIHVFLSEAGGYLNGVSAINTISADIITPNGDIALGNKSLSGGVCGSLIFEQGLKVASLLANEREKLGLKKQDFGLIGVGGVMTAQNFSDYLNAGVDLVQAATGMMWNLNLAKDVADFLGVSYTIPNYELERE